MPERFTVEAGDAQLHFPQLLQAVQDGARVTITSGEQPLAEIGPPGPPVGDRDAAAVLAAMEQRWAEAEPMIVGPYATQARR